ncbi:hypothetical protein MXB_2319, partial [Myxobolus squamalis]
MRVAKLGCNKHIFSIKKCSKQELLLNNCKYVFPEIFIKGNNDQTIKCMNFIQSEMSISISNILKSELQAIIHH